MFLICIVIYVSNEITFANKLYLLFHTIIIYYYILTWYKLHLLDYIFIILEITLWNYYIIYYN